MSPAMEGSVALAPKWANRHESMEMTGAVSVTVSVRMWDMWPALLLASITTLVTPVSAGVPEIWPELGSTVSPAGSGPALYVIGVVPPEEVMA
jgi:hypothetical protein